TTSVDPERTKRFGLGSTTAREMAGLFEALAAGDKLPPASKQAVLGHLKKNQDKDKVTRVLPEGKVVAHQDGSGNAARTDAGVIYTPGGAVVVCVLTDDNEDQRWAPDNAGNLLCARVAQAVYDFYRPPPP